ncbi:unnamed protein product [Calicophoron daubneyi]|uniref:Bms1-type G domain-containing protein n=1 Tax=Calicophoron daubneyi TaxID=300641 RepID=A0AAV2TJU4_CALDB
MTLGDSENQRDDVKKKHRSKQSGPKAQKKLSKPEDASKHNVKAFAVQHTTKAARLVQRTLDHQMRKQHVPQSVHIVDAPPPIVIALVGPPKSGKTTLLKSLIKHFAHQSISVIKGPLTVVVGKKVRLTFIECGCDINSMLDAAKIADVVLLVVNVRAGLEMYHFEFINMLQVHGLPRVIPVLNHLDTFKDSSSSRALRRKIKQRLWVDLNSKIFLLTRFQPKKYAAHDRNSTNDQGVAGDYLLAEVRRLARMIVVKIPRVTDWRASHPYLLVDRLEDITEHGSVSDNPPTDRTVTMYGWVRGAPLPPALTSPGMHIAGLGDFALADCTRQPDPCPLPSQVVQSQSTSSTGRPSRHLAERDRKIYAPMSSLGGVLFDRDATYIDLGGSHYLTSNNKLRGKVSNQSAGATHAALEEVQNMFQEIGGMDEQLEKEHRVRIVGDAPYLLPENVESTDEDGEGDEEENEEADEEGTSGSASDVKDDEDISPMETEPEEDVKALSDGLLAGFLVPAGTKLPEVPTNSSKKTEVKQIPHLEAKAILDELHWKPTTASLVNWNRIVYGAENDKKATQTVDKQTGEFDSIAGGLLQPMKSDTFSAALQGTDQDFTLWLMSHSPVKDWTDPSMDAQIANRFTTGKWDANEDASTLLKTDIEARAQLAAEEAKKHALATAGHTQYKPNRTDDMDSGEEALGYDESEEGGSDVGDGDIFRDGDSSEESEMDGDEGKSGESSDEKESDPNAEFEKSLLRPTKRQKLLEKRERHKALFNQLYEAAGGGPEATAYYDKIVAAREAQIAANKKVLESLPEDVVERLEGFPPGAYVRMVLKGVPARFLERFNPCQPLVAGGLPSVEESKGYLQIRFRTHRWLRRVLRSNDPVSVSIGWRRYQSVGVFSKEEHNLRNKFLKYSLSHEHCFVTIYGPIVSPKTGALLFMNSAWRPESSDSNNLPKFRIAGTGSVTSTDQSFQIVKKLKLIGEPYKIFSKTAFIHGMFNSALEVSKMIGARIQTVSNIRGLIKAALTNPSVSKPGDFRATFEAQIRKSDLVFLRSFVAVELPKYYNPVLNRLFPIIGEEESGEDGNGWRLLRTLTELRREAGEKPQANPDSQYKPIHRPVFVPAPLCVPTKLVAQLPFAHRPKPTRREARAMLGGDPIRSALSDELPPPVRPAIERDMDSRDDLLFRLRELHADFKQRQRDKMVSRVTKHKKELAKKEQRKAANDRRKRKSYFARQGAKLGKKGQPGE